MALPHLCISSPRHPSSVIFPKVAHYTTTARDARNRRGKYLGKARLVQDSLMGEGTEICESSTAFFSSGPGTEII